MARALLVLMLTLTGVALTPSTTAAPAASAAGATCVPHTTVEHIDGMTRTSFHDCPPLPPR